MATFRTIEEAKCALIQFASCTLGEKHLGNIIFEYFMDETIKYNNEFDNHYVTFWPWHGNPYQQILAPHKYIIEKLNDYAKTIGHLPRELDITLNNQSYEDIDWIAIHRAFPNIYQNLHSLKMDGVLNSEHIPYFPNLHELSIENSQSPYRNVSYSLLCSDKIPKLEKLTVGPGVFSSNKDFQQFLHNPNSFVFSRSVKDLDFLCFGSFAFLKSFPNLKKLTLRSENVKNTRQKYLSFPELSELHLLIKDLSEHNYMFDVPKLTKLTIEFSNCSSLDFLRTINTQNLVSLQIKMSNPSHEFLNKVKQTLVSFIASCPRLQEFTCNVPIDRT